MEKSPSLPGEILKLIFKVFNYIFVPIRINRLNDLSNNLKKYFAWIKFSRETIIFFFYAN